MQDYRKLRVWQNAHQLALHTYELPAYLQKPEAWPLRDQPLTRGDFNLVEHRRRSRPRIEPGFLPVSLAFDGIVQ